MGAKTLFIQFWIRNSEIAKSQKYIDHFVIIHALSYLQICANLDNAKMDELRAGFFVRKKCLCALAGTHKPL